MVALLVLGQHHQVPARLVHLALAQRLVATAGHIHLAAEDGHEGRAGGLLGHLGLQTLSQRVGGGVGGYFQCAGVELFQLGLALDLDDIVEELLDAHHVAVVGDGHAFHAVGQGLIDQGGDGRLAVEEGVLGMYVKVNEVAHGGVDV